MIKLVWGLRAFFFNLITTFKLPGYIGKPIYINKIKRMKFGKKVRIYPGIRAEIISEKRFYRNWR